MAGYRFPGVFPTIVDNSEVVADNTIVSAAYVGESEYGPVFKPTLLSSLQDYTNKFGKLNSKYGYAGYSLAVAAETISQHYFVRVVPTGKTGEHTANDAKWAANGFAKEGAEPDAGASTAMYYEEVIAAQNSRETGNNDGLFSLVNGSSTTWYDNTAFKIVTLDPNNRDFYITIANSTINENKAYAISANTTVTWNETKKEATLTVTLPCQVNADGSYGIGGEFSDAAVGNKIAVSKMIPEILNGIFEIKTITPNDNDQVVITYVVKSETEIVAADINDSNARIGLYPENDQTTFSLTLSEKVGRVISVLESYEFLTLYPAQDQYGNSTFIEDVINGSSEHIQVFANTHLIETQETENKVVVPAYVSNIQLTGGQSGTFADASAKYSKLCEAWELFRDRSRVTVSLLMNSGYALKGNTSYQAKMLEIAEARRDCFCLFDIPMTETAYEDAIDWRRNVQGFNTYRGALSAPWIKTYDSIQGRANFIMCPSAYVAKIIGAYDPWKAPAGLNRGILSAAAVAPTGLTQYYNETEGGNLYTDNQINCIIRNPGAGYVNWGQRTLQQKPSALDRINVARTVIYIETVLRDAARYHVFENNNASERQQITLQFNAFLDQVLSSEGITSYRVQCDERNNTPQVIANNQMKIDIYLVPSFCSEFILLTTTVENGIATTTVSTGS